MKTIRLDLNNYVNSFLCCHRVPGNHPTWKFLDNEPACSFIHLVIAINLQGMWPSRLCENPLDLKKIIFCFPTLWNTSIRKLIVLKLSPDVQIWLGVLKRVSFRLYIQRRYWWPVIMGGFIDFCERVPWFHSKRCTNTGFIGSVSF